MVPKRLGIPEFEFMAIFGVGTRALKLRRINIGRNTPEIEDVADWKRSDEKFWKEFDEKTSQMKK